MRSRQRARAPRQVAPVTRPTLVLGIDPGKRTGLALLRPTMAAPWTCVASWTIPLDDLPHALTRGVVAASCPKGKTLVALETWRAMGARKMLGLAHQAYAAGVAWSAATIAGHQVIALNRNQVLTAARFPKLCDKAYVRRALPAFVTAGTKEQWLSNEHERDAALVAFIGGGRVIGAVS